MFGVIGQSNNFANCLGAALLSVAFLRSRGVLGAGAAALMALLLSTGMALSGSRTSWGYMAVSLVFVPLLLRRGSPEAAGKRSEEHTSELQSLTNLVCRLLLEKKNHLEPCKPAKGEWV